MAQIKKQKRKDRNKNIRTALLVLSTSLLGAVAWTNESIDYLAKIGIQNVNPGITLLISVFLFNVSLAFLMVEVLKK